MPWNNAVSMEIVCCCLKNKSRIIGKDRQQDLGLIWTVLSPDCINAPTVLVLVHFTSTLLSSVERTGNGSPPERYSTMKRFLDCLSLYRTSREKLLYSYL